MEDLEEELPEPMPSLSQLGELKPFSLDLNKLQFP